MATSKTSPLQVDFYESGIGETIIITFPDGGIGIVDAHPSPHSDRPDILDLVKEKTIHFLCLSHPHADHGLDLIPILKTHKNITAFWHTLTDVDVFVFSETQTENYLSPYKEMAAAHQEKWAKYLQEIFGNVALQRIPTSKLVANREFEEIAGVKIHFLSPEEIEQNKFSKANQEIANGKRKKHPDPNKLSAIIALEYKGKVILLGADALKKNWQTAIKHYKKADLPNPIVLKVPHHGAANALELQNSGNKPNYLDLCEKETLAILFAGDSKHPDDRVELKLRDKTTLACLANGKKRTPRNPLGIGITEARQANTPIQPCQSNISITINASGEVNLDGVITCDTCPKAMGACSP